MSWHYRDPLTFPAIFIEATINAAESPNTEIFVYTSNSLSDVEAKASQLRWFRWCVKQRPDNITRIARLLENYSYRSRIVTENGRAMLYILAREDRWASIAALNPSLAYLIETA